MPDNKKHHFVPRVYLKNFSVNGRVINLYNLANDRVVFNAALKSQCYRDYFYGQDQVLEKALGMMEGFSAKLFRKIIECNAPPEPGSEEYAQLVTFVIFQRNRTSQAARAIDEMVASVAKEVISYHPKFDSDFIDLVDIGVKDPAIEALKAASHTLPFALDLACKLLVAKPGSEFVTTDNPVVFYNQALEGVSAHHGLGTASKGLQVFFPVSPSCMIFLYDHSLYKVGGRRERTILVSEQEDIDQLNILLLANAEENIYFLDSDRINLRLIKRGIKFRLENTSELHVVSERKKDGVRSNLIINQGIRPKVGLNLSFIKEFASAEHLRQLAVSGVIRHPGLIRDPDLVQWVELWQQSVEAGSKQNFYQFMASQK